MAEADTRAKLRDCFADLDGYNHPPRPGTRRASHRRRTGDGPARLAAVLGGYPVAANPAGLELDVLVNDVETRPAEKDSMIERLREVPGA